MGRLCGYLCFSVLFTGSYLWSAFLAPNVYEGDVSGYGGITMYVDANGVIKAELGGPEYHTSETATNRQNGAIVIRFSPRHVFHGRVRYPRTEIAGRLVVDLKNGATRVYPVRLLPKYIPIAGGVYDGRAEKRLDGYIVTFENVPSFHGYRAYLWFPYGYYENGGGVRDAEKLVVFGNGRILIRCKNIVREEHLRLETATFVGKWNADENTIGGHFTVVRRNFGSDSNYVQRAPMTLRSR